MNKFLSYVNKNRIYSLLWRAAVFAVVAGLGWIGENIGWLELNAFWITTISLVIAEVTKALNNWLRNTPLPRT